MLKVELNRNVVEDNSPLIAPGGVTIMITPPIGEDYWMMRVPLSTHQAIVCFPKFGTIGIGFQKEEDWNTNLPYTCEAEEIYDHIEHNKGDHKIEGVKCIEAIELLQSRIKLIRNSKNQ